MKQHRSVSLPTRAFHQNQKHIDRESFCPFCEPGSSLPVEPGFAELGHLGVTVSFRLLAQADTELREK